MAENLITNTGHELADETLIAVRVVTVDPTSGLPSSSGSATLQYTDGGGNPVPVTEVLPLPVEQAAADRTVDAIAAALQTDAIMNGHTVLTPKTAFANVSASQTDSSIVAAVTSKKIRVLGVVAHAAGTATNITFNSKGAGAGTAITHTIPAGANGGEVLPGWHIGWFESASGEALTVTTGAGSTTGILVRYVEV